jgi:hypothetical protein
MIQLDLRLKGVNYIKKGLKDWVLVYKMAE